jgi:hydroxymethylbilane synthase
VKIIIGTRGSQLALAQAGQVLEQIARLLPGNEVRLEVIKTTGDGLSVPGAPADPLVDPPQGIFTKELDEALLSGRIHGAIHSLKDVPTQLPAGIVMGLYLKREDFRDALISKSGQKFYDLPPGSRIGTSSPRREAQIRAARPDLKVVPLRGNVDTRIRKLQAGEMEAIIVAAAGLRRLGRSGEATELLEPEIMLPAPAQGVLGVTWLMEDRVFNEVLQPLNDSATKTCATAERAFLKTLQGGCKVPVGALATIDGGVLSLEGVIAHPGGRQIMRKNLKGKVDTPSILGDALAKKFLDDGAQKILDGFGRISR